ncbi:glutamate [NMDA] receptor subunit 1 isoform X2 [Nasonia vitripennis]|uniref:Receptor ligand binding region domain-containing protein n=1 Tax=Nasonia vitripennis TaxID=7425 RepID=A0A7M7QDV5_NASVI|nr:glutamate [NMDA] receptor subunit 1 isoform X2 [Nasonia vitripennis]
MESRKITFKIFADCNMQIKSMSVRYFIFLAIIIRQYAKGKHSQTFNNPGYFKIGGMLSDGDSEAFFNETIDNLNFASQYVNKGVTYGHVVIAMDSNPIRTALNVCKFLIAQKVYAIIVSHPPVGELSPAAVSYTSGFYHIPVIGISSRDSAFSDKNIHVSFLRTVPPYSHQADVWVELLKYFNYMKVIFIHSSDTDGRSLLGRFQSTSQILEDDMEVKIQVENVIEFEPGLSNFKSELLLLKSAQSRVYLMYASAEDAEIIFKNAAELNMTGAGYVWLVTEQALNSNNVPEGVLGLKLINVTNEKSHIKDSLYVLVSALREMNQTESITEAPQDCDNSGLIWETGKKLFEYVRQQTLENGATGRVAFDDNGDRIYAEYDVVNSRLSNKFVSVGQYYYSSESSKMKLIVNDSIIIWPGKIKNKPEGFLIPTHLKVLTVEEKPFVYVRKATGMKCEVEEVLCPNYKSNKDDVLSS